MTGSPNAVKPTPRRVGKGAAGRSRCRDKAWISVQGRRPHTVSGRDPRQPHAGGRAFDQHLTRAWQQALREKRSPVVLLIDVDHFKAYNDHYAA